MKRTIYFSLYLSMLLTGCGSNIIVTNPDYINTNISNKKILLMPLAGDAINIQNKEDVSDCFEDYDREPEEIIREVVNDNITKTVKKSLKSVTLLGKVIDPDLFQSQRDTSQYFSIIKRLGKDSTIYRFYIPKKAMLEKIEVNPDIVLVINKIFFGSGQNVYGTSYVPGQTITTPGGSFTTPGHAVGGGSTPYLKATFVFTIYDYTENKIIKCGKAEVKKNYIFMMTDSTWLSLINSIPEIIFNDPPFRWEISYY